MNREESRRSKDAPGESLFWRLASLMSLLGVLFSTGPVLAHPENGGGMRGTCQITNTNGRAEMVVSVENISAKPFSTIEPQELLAGALGNASIFFQATPRPSRNLLPSKTARFKWKGLLFGDGFLDLSLEVFAEYGDGHLETSGIINCNRLAVGNPDLAGVVPGERPTQPVSELPTQRPSAPTPTAQQPPSGPATRPTRTTRPTSTPRPTRTTRPESTARPTRTPIAARSTQRPAATSTSRPTRTAIQARPTRTPIQARATRTPRQPATPRPTRTAIEARNPTSPPSNPGNPSNPSLGSGLQASCSLRRTIDLVQITLLVANRTGSPVTNVQGGQLILEPEGGSLFFDQSGPSPRSHSGLSVGSPVTFQWSGRLSSGGTMGFGTSATARMPDGTLVGTGAVNCGVATAEDDSFNPQGFEATCQLVAGENGRIIFAVRNSTGGDLTNVQPFLRDTTGDGSAQIFDINGPGPRSTRRMSSGHTSEFVWRAQVLGSGEARAELEALANRPSGERISTGSIECSTIVSSPGGGGDGLPDLTVSQTDLRDSILIETVNFASNQCAVQEGCVAGPGLRRLLRFTTTTPNLGPGDFFVGDPRTSPLMSLDTCHNHFHWEGYAEARLFDLQGNLVSRGHKASFCLVDLWPVPGVAGSTAPTFVDCGFQGISAGWADIYHRNLDCQWVDITGVPAGRYVLEVRVNPERTIGEVSYSNNAAQTEVVIPPDNAR